MRLCLTRITSSEVLHEMFLYVRKNRKLQKAETYQIRKDSKPKRESEHTAHGMFNSLQHRSRHQLSLMPSSILILKFKVRTWPQSHH